MAMGMPYCQCVNAFEREVQNWHVGRGVACCTWKGLVPCLCNSSGIISSCNENKSNAMRVTVRILIHMSGKFPPNLTFLLLEGIFTLPRTEWKSPMLHWLFAKLENLWLLNTLSIFVASFHPISWYLSRWGDVNCDNWAAYEDGGVDFAKDEEPAEHYLRAAHRALTLGGLAREGLMRQQTVGISF